MSGGGSAPTEKLRAASLQLPLAGFRDGLVVGPVEYRAPAHVEKAGQLGIRVQSEQLLYGGFGHVHDDQV